MIDLQKDSSENCYHCSQKMNSGIMLVFKKRYYTIQSKSETAKPGFQ
jgi:hypothetical protein